MQKEEMGVPLCAHVDTETETMIVRETEIIRMSFIYKSERAMRISVPGVRRNYVEGGSQLRLKGHYAGFGPATAGQFLNVLIGAVVVIVKPAFPKSPESSVDHQPRAVIHPASQAIS